ncbi:alkaline phosphatase family protein [Granulicella cerasi]|uniref:Alkaline phosphatase family protein n=1 Tax=Granulicella cerasi TaxID=741063 RepID=A0ABW1ZB00_9BACT|nr:ectonucleotide pyrophosphatase/phosphodiesterase [Granulicella cerasi]
MNKLRGLACVLVSCGVAAVAQKPAPLVLISIDGMKPEYVTRAKEHGLKLPELESFLAQGTYAEGVQGVLPTVTYPSHTTLVTGVSPLVHGVEDNTTFDPMNEHPGQWYWEFRYVKAQTLYQAADKAGIKTGAVSWPVTVGAPIDYNIAEGAQSERTDASKIPGYNPPNILAQLGFPTPKDAEDLTMNGDETKTAQSIAILKKWKPGLLLVHLVSLDHFQHGYGPFSKEADEALLKIDAEVKRIEDAAHAADPRTRIAIVSDHGFLPVDQHTNLNKLFVDAGLITLGAPKPGSKKPTITSWQAQAWPAGGSVAIVLRNPNDKAMVEKVHALLLKWKSDPALGLDNLLTHDQAVAMGGFPHATFVVDFKDGWDMGYEFTGKSVVPAPHTGMHGYLPTRPAMRSTFMVKGEGVKAGKDVGVIDMRQIAPTLAELLGVKLTDAKMEPVDVK